MGTHSTKHQRSSSHEHAQSGLRYGKGSRGTAAASDLSSHANDDTSSKGGTDDTASKTGRVRRPIDLLNWRVKVSWGGDSIL